MKTKLRIKTLFMSDVHLGMADSKAVQAAHLIRHCKCEKLVLNGDIIDAWALSGSGRWTQEHTHFVRTVLQKLAKWKGCHGIICGHIHTPADKMIEDVHYLNSGDWVESMTVVVEHLDRTFEVLSYHDFCRLTGREPKGTDLSMNVSDISHRPLGLPAPVVASEAGEEEEAEEMVGV